MEKYCKTCQIYKKFTDFHKHKKGQFGLYPECKLCRKNNYKLKNNDYTTNIKKCKNCNLNLESKYFYKNKNLKSGLTSRCKKCFLQRRSENQSKLENYMNIILQRFNKKNKGIFDVNQLVRRYNQQRGNCFISNHKMTHIIDTKGRCDNIFNASIIPIKEKKEYGIDDIKLGINLFYSVGKIYNLDSDKILNIYKELS